MTEMTNPWNQLQSGAVWLVLNPDEWEKALSRGMARNHERTKVYIENKETKEKECFILNAHLECKDQMHMIVESKANGHEVDGARKFAYYVQIDWYMCLKDYGLKLHDNFGMHMLSMRRDFRVLPIDAIMRVVFRERLNTGKGNPVYEYKRVYDSPNVDQRDRYYAEKSDICRNYSGAQYDPMSPLGALKDDCRLYLSCINDYAIFNKGGRGVPTFEKYVYHVKREAPEQPEERKRSRQRTEKQQEVPEVVDVDATMSVEDAEVEKPAEAIVIDDQEQVQPSMDIDNINSQRGGEAYEFEPTPGTGDIVNNKDNTQDVSEKITEIISSSPCVQSTENSGDIEMNVERPTVDQRKTSVSLENLVEYLTTEDVDDINASIKKYGIEFQRTETKVDNEIKEDVSRKLNFSKVTPLRLAFKSSQPSCEPPKTESKRASSKYLVENRVKHLKFEKYKRLRHLEEFMNCMTVEWKSGHETFCANIWKLFIDNNWDIQIANKLIVDHYMKNVDRDYVMLVDLYADEFCVQSFEKSSNPDKNFPLSFELIAILTNEKKQFNYILKLAEKILEIKTEMKIPRDMVGAAENTPKSIITWILKQILFAMHPDKLGDIPEDLRWKEKEAASFTSVVLNSISQDTFREVCNDSERKSRADFIRKMSKEFLEKEDYEPPLNQLLKVSRLH